MAVFNKSTTTLNMKTCIWPHSENVVSISILQKKTLIASLYKINWVIFIIKTVFPVWYEMLLHV
jgi:hypothetical protein